MLRHVPITDHVTSDIRPKLHCYSRKCPTLKAFIWAAYTEQGYNTFHQVTTNSSDNSYTETRIKQVNVLQQHTTDGLDWIEQGLTSHSTHCRSFLRRTTDE